MNDFDFEEENNDKYLNPREKWEQDNDTGIPAGKCSICGSTIYQSTYGDQCMCGESDYAY
jgi:hypothetical protein